MVRLSRSARRNHLGNQITQIHSPALLMWGRQDVVTPPEAAEQFHRLLPDSRLVWFDQCGHVPMVEQADGFATELVRFTEEISQSRTS
ncbi:MAG: alpha/beta hydrolase [Planctomycetota bacterium]|nr:MAG: alpha/beta hydrolase [Planctomycetota bacterium]